jgi:hypothetical protein
MLLKKDLLQHPNMVNKQTNKVYGIPNYFPKAEDPTARAAPRAQGLEHICNTSFGDPRPAKWVKIPPEIKWETPMAAQVITAAHGDIKG